MFWLQSWSKIEIGVDFGKFHAKITTQQYSLLIKSITEQIKWYKHLLRLHDDIVQSYAEEVKKKVKDNIKEATQKLKNMDPQSVASAVEKGTKALQQTNKMLQNYRFVFLYQAKSGLLEIPAQALLHWETYLSDNPSQERNQMSKLSFENLVIAVETQTALHNFKLTLDSVEVILLFFLILLVF